MAVGDVLEPVPQPDKIQNVDVLDLSVRVDRWCKEMNDCPSSTRNESIEDDRGVWRGLYEDLNAKFSLASSAPELYLPKYHPHALGVQAQPQLINVQNADIMSLTNLLRAWRTELTHSNNAERSSGFAAGPKGESERVLERLGKMLDEIDSRPEQRAPNAPDQKATGTAG